MFTIPSSPLAAARQPSAALVSPPTLARRVQYPNTALRTPSRILGTVCPLLPSTSRLGCVVNPPAPSRESAAAANARPRGRREVVSNEACTRRVACAAASSSGTESGDGSLEPEGKGAEPASPPSSSQASEGGADSGSNSAKHQLEWFLIKYPLLVASTYAKSNEHWLEQRDRKRWWKRGIFPKVPKDRIETVKLKQPVKLWQKVAPLGLIFFCASFNLTLLQNLKDSIIVTAAGPETLPWLASFCVLPASLVFFALYSKLVSNVPPKHVFYWSLTPLVVFYVFFATVLFPNSATLHPIGALESVAALLPAGLHGLIRVVEMWTFSLFFCFAELWGAVAISLLFWSLANDVCTVDDAKTIYPLMGVSANMALVVAGNYMKYINKSFTAGNVGLSLNIFVATIVATTVLMCSTKLFLDKKVLPEKTEKSKAKPKKKKSKGSFKESIELLRSSPRILNLALLVVSYALSHRLFEFAWKGQLRVLFPLATDYQGALSDVSIATGYTTIVLMLLGKFVFEYLGWGFAAAATPTVMLVAGTAFFGLSLAARFRPELPMLATAGVTAGAATQVFARASKFSLFDPAKEMVYIEMDAEEKSKGKAAVDLVGSQMGKSGSAWIIQALLLVLGSAAAVLPYISVVFVAVIAVWLVAASQLKAQLALHAERQKKEQAEAKALAAARAAEEEQSVAATNGHHAADGAVNGGVGEVPVEDEEGEGDGPDAAPGLIRSTASGSN